MSFSKPCYPEDQAARYELILAQAASLLDETLNPIANLANMAALLADALPRINWCGFYLLDGGAPVADLMVRGGIPFSQLRAVFVTHMHSDHTFGIPHLCSLANWYFVDASF